MLRDEDVKVRRKRFARAIEGELRALEPKLAGHAHDRDANALWRTRANILKEGIVEASGKEKEGKKAARGRGKPASTWALQRPQLPTCALNQTNFGKEEADRIWGIRVLG